MQQRIISLPHRTPMRHTLLGVSIRRCSDAYTCAFDCPISPIYLYFMHGSVWSCHIHMHIVSLSAVYGLCTVWNVRAASAYSSACVYPADGARPALRASSPVGDRALGALEPIVIYWSAFYIFFGIFYSYSRETGRACDASPPSTAVSALRQCPVLPGGVWACTESPGWVPVLRCSFDG